MKEEKAIGKSGGFFDKVATMNLSEKELEEMLKAAFGEALKDRFSKIAANELTLGPDEGEREFKKMFENLKMAYDQVTRIIPEFFPPKCG